MTKKNVKISNKSNITYKNYINRNYSSCINIISFLLDILFRKLNDVSYINNFIYKLVFDKNIEDKIKTKILNILNKTLKEDEENNIKQKIFIKEDILNDYLSEKNENKFYFFMSYNESIISYNIIKFIINIYTCKKDEINDIIINYVNELFNKINNDIELKCEIPQFLEEYKSSIKFNNDILYLEIFQVISIIIEIKDIEWLFENIFTNIIWVNFSKTKQTSLKRSLCIFYSGVLADLYIKKGIKDNNNTNNILENDNFKKIFGWIFSIYNPPKENEYLLSFYDKLCALCWVAESPLMNISNKVPDKIKEITIKLINNNSENLFPTDFLNKLKKLKIIE